VSAAADHSEGAGKARPKAVLFDWDNTLVDTWPTIHEAINATFAAFGFDPWTYEETCYLVRRSLRDSFPAIFGERWEEARKVFYDRFEAIHLDGLRPHPGAMEMLGQLKDAGLYLGVVSNKSGRYLRAEVAHLAWDGYFERVVGALDADRDKPATAPVEMALAGSGIECGAEVWFAGDTEIDLECAHNAGCVPVLVRAKAPKPGEFGPFAPVWHVTDCLALCKLIGRL
jgi:phosphoglycolate phosphatase